MIRKQFGIYSIALVFLVSIFISLGLQAEDAKKTEKLCSSGKIIKVMSKVFDKEIEISIYLPENYEKSEKKYPVLYSIMGSFTFGFDSETAKMLNIVGAIPGMIVVGLPEIATGYVPYPLEAKSIREKKGADVLIKYLKNDLIPYINANYRTNDFRIVYGHSVGGLFTMYTLFTEPDLFSAYIAGSPWFQWNDKYWLKNFSKIPPKAKFDNKHLYMTVGSLESDITKESFTELEKLMKESNFQGLTWESEWLDDVDHGSMVGYNSYKGLLKIFQGWKIPNSVIETASPEKILAYYETLSNKLGFRVDPTPPEYIVSRVARSLLEKEPEKAMALFELNVKLYPESSMTNYYIAEAYTKTGENEKAVEHYKKSIKFNRGKREYEKRQIAYAKNKIKELTEKK